MTHYFYALTAHFGRWEKRDGKKPVWVLLSEFLYGQVIKHQRRRRTVAVERRLLWGKEKHYRERLRGAGLSGKINTAFVERLNLTIRQCVSKQTRRTWGPAHFSPELMDHLEWWRGYYHFVRYHESLAEVLEHPHERKGRQQPCQQAGIPLSAQDARHGGWANGQALDGKGTVILSFAVIGFGVGEN